MTANSTKFADQDSQVDDENSPVTKRTGSGTASPEELSQAENQGGDGPVDQKDQAPYNREFEDIAKHLRDPQDRADWKTNINRFDDGGPKLKNRFSRRKRVASMLGLGTAGTAIFMVLTLAPILHVPSLMGALLDKAGQQAQDVVETRVSRMIISYLFARTATGGDKFIITGSPVDSLFATWKANRFERKIFDQTGFRLVRDGSGRVHLEHDGRDKGTVRNYDELMELASKDQLLRRDLTRIVKLTRSWNIGLSSRIARLFAIRYHVSYRPIKYDNKLKPEENLTNFRKQEIDLVKAQSVDKVGVALLCMVSGEDCKSLDPDNAETEPGKAQSEHARESAGQVASELESAAEETIERGAKTGQEVLGHAMVDVISKKIEKSVTAKAMFAFIPIVGQIDLVATLVHITKEISENEIIQRLPAILAEQATAAQALKWQNNGSLAMANQMDLHLLNELNDRLKGANQAASYSYTFTGEAKGTPVETRINNNREFPALDYQNWFFNHGPGNVTLAVFDPIWYETIGQGGLFGLIGDVGVGILEKVFGGPLGNAAEAIFGPEWKSKMAVFAAESTMRLLAISVEPMARGAKLFNQLYSGMDAAMNAYCRVNLGCQAISSLVDAGYFNNPVRQNSLLPHDLKSEMAALSLSERLFSMNESHSLISQFARRMPTEANPLSLTSGVIQSVIKLPATLGNLFTGTARAAATTPEQDAAIAGVRQYGATVQSLDQEMAPQTYQEVNPTCPEVDQETTFNLCKADTEVIKILMCTETDCPELQDGSSVTFGDYNFSEIMNTIKYALTRPISESTATLRSMW